jgi:hypothetical protein
MRSKKIAGSLLIIAYGSIIHGQTYPHPDISRVLVDPVTNYVHIYFTGTDHPDATHYKISQWMITGNNPIASGVPIESSSMPNTGAPAYHWTDYIEQVVAEPVGFTVGSYNGSDEPVNQSYPPDSTIFLSALYDSCSASVSLHWNDYNAWRGRIKQYEVIGSNTAGTYNILAILHEGSNDTVISGLQANNDYLFYVLARENSLNPDSFVTSNGIRFSTLHAYYPEYIHADYGTVDNDNHPYLHFSIDPLSELTMYRLSRAEAHTGPYSIIDSFNIVGNTFEYTDDNANAAQRPYFYTLTAVNYCNQPILTSENIAGTIHLTGLAAGTSVQLDWTPYYEWTTGVSGYTIERNLSGEGYQILTDTQLLSYTDNSFGSLTGQQINSEVCYRITANELPGSIHSVNPASSTSNIVCVNLPVNIRFEYNAIAPDQDGFSQFGPIMDFLPRFFDFRIYNRWGTKIFESTDPESPNWDGRYDNGEIVSEGVYRYQLEYEDENGKRIILNGKVSVVRE